MTALSGPILFNNSTGSDTTASGCGPATAVTTSAMFSSGSAGITVSSSTGMSVGDLIYVPANTGRKFNVIASISGTSITCDDNWDDSQNGVSIYVGGKRATLENSVQLFEYTYSNGKEIEAVLETDQTLTQPVTGTGGRGVRLTIRSDDPSTRRSITTSDTHLFGGGYMVARDLEFYTTNTGTTHAFLASIYSSNINAQTVKVHNCVFGNASNPWYRSIYRTSVSQSFHGHRCVFQNTTSDCFWNQIDVTVTSSIFRNNSGFVFATAGTDTAEKSPRFVNCVMHDNTEGFYFHSGTNGVFAGNVIHNCGTSYSAVRVGRANMRLSGFVGNIFSDCSIAPRTDLNTDSFNVGNAYYNSGWSGFTNEVDPITLQANPFVDPTASPPDFNLNNALGGGSVLRSTKFTLGG